MIWTFSHLDRRNSDDEYQNPNDDDQAVASFLRQEAILGKMTNRCEEFLDGQVFENQIRLDSGENTNELSIFAPVGSSTIQTIINDHQELDTIRLRRPPPSVLPLVISRIENERNSFIIPSEDLRITALLPRAPRYQLEAVMCDINDRYVIFIRNISADRWYYYQENYSCEQLSENLNTKLNQIIRARTTTEQRRLIRSAHFLISMIFYNAVRYIYKREDD